VSESQGWTSFTDASANKDLFPTTEKKITPNHFKESELIEKTKEALSPWGGGCGGGNKWKTFLLAEDRSVSLFLPREAAEPP
jgi:hypothetical protein